jgi:hypothetical protein
MEQIGSFARIAPYLTNPLVLIGFVLLLVFGVHRSLIRSGLLRPISQQQSSAVVKLLLKYGLLIALVIVALGFGYVYFTTYLGHAAQVQDTAARADLQRQKWPCP